MGELRNSITKTLSDTPDREEVNNLVLLSGRMALAYLLQKVRRGSLRPDRHRISLEDVAIDCCSKLFIQDEDGRFVQFQACIQQTEWETIGEVDLEILLRRIVFSQVNEILFSRGLTSDRKIRDLTTQLKRSLESHGDSLGLTVVHAGGGVWLKYEPGDDERQGYPLIPNEIVEAVLSGHVNKEVAPRKVLEVVEGILREHNYYRSRYPLQGVAEAIHAIQTVKVEPAEFSSASLELRPELLGRSEIEKAFDTVDKMVQRVAGTSAPRPVRVRY